MKRIFIVIGMLLLLVFAATCSNPTEPSNNNGNQSDTTSHNFVWQKFTFGGGGGSSVLHDVAVINDTSIWAVGEIYMKDSLGNDDPIAYNAVHWNGKNWKVEKIKVWYRSNPTIAPLTGIFILQDDKIVLSSGLPYLPNESGGWELYQLWDMGILNQNDGSVNHIWGTSLNNLFFAGNNGTIVHYTNGIWQKIESGSTLDIQDIWGEVDQKTNQTTVLAVASNIFQNNGMNLLQIRNNAAASLTTQGLSWSLSGVWFEIGKQYYVVGDGIFQKQNLDEAVWKNKPLDFTQYYTYRIRGNSYNDIMVVGSQGEVLHYNGNSWKSFRDQTSLGYGNYYSVSVKGNTVVAVGQDGDNAVITIGRRN